MVAAACPKCTIYLIEANSTYASDIGTAVSEAVTLGAHIVNASWLCPGSLTCFDPSIFDAPGVVYVAAAGNLGYDQNGSPEALATVVSVGGTVLFKKGSKYSEKVWDGSGGGCSSNGGSTGV
jgi:subtilisin family serine protease